MRPGTASTPDRYGRVDVLLHWALAAALIAQIAFGFLLDDIAPRGTPARAGVINLHKSIGMVLGLLAIARIGWRLSHPAPAWPASMPDWERRAARIAHAAMHVCMVIVPLSGWVASNFIKYGVDFFGLVKMPPFGSPSPAVYAFFNGLHDIGAWLLSALVCVHVIAALKHALVDRDGLFSRMWTFQSKEGATQ